eukprot:1573264-Lingulodinium_polyedra.AAC.1
MGEKGGPAPGPLRPLRKAGRGPSRQATLAWGNTSTAKQIQWAATVTSEGLGRQTPRTPKQSKDKALAQIFAR